MVYIFYDRELRYTSYSSLKIVINFNFSHLRALALELPEGTLTCTLLADTFGMGHAGSVAAGGLGSVRNLGKLSLFWGRISSLPLLSYARVASSSVCYRHQYMHYLLHVNIVHTTCLYLFFHTYLCIICVAFSTLILRVQAPPCLLYTSPSPRDRG